MQSFQACQTAVGWAALLLHTASRPVLIIALAPEPRGQNAAAVAASCHAQPHHLLLGVHGLLLPLLDQRLVLFGERYRNL